MNTSAIRNSLTFTRNARAMLGNDSLNCSPLKNASLTSSQPGALMIGDRQHGEEHDRADHGDPHRSSALGAPATGPAEDPGPPAPRLLQQAIDLVVR